MKKASTSQLIRDRIKELRRVKASLLVPNPKNWRIHGKQQAAALKGLLHEVGYADALLARELPDGTLMLIDGHLRAETTPHQEVPVLILDVTEAEADKILLTLDPLAGMAEANQIAIEQLLETVTTESEAVGALASPLGSRGRPRCSAERQGGRAAKEMAHQASVLSHKYGE